MKDAFSLECGIESPAERVLLGHGSGGQLMHRLLADVLLPIFDDPALADGHDSALLAAEHGELAFTTDSYVVTPRFFPGGDIGELAVYGTVNDLAMSGAEPLYLSCGFILEEGLAIEELKRIARSMKTAATACGIRIVTGDTKVVERGKGDGIYINTTGVGRVLRPLAPQRIRAGDAILVSGDIGRHGMAIMSVREGLAFDEPITSDCGSLAPLARELTETLDDDLHCLRDLTRGGLATNLRELCDAAAMAMTIEEAAIPVDETVRGACELLGLDPLYLACEGRMAVVVNARRVEAALDILRRHHARAAVVGEVQAGRPQLVARTPYGSERRIERLPGQLLPRIC